MLIELQCKTNSAQKTHCMTFRVNGELGNEFKIINTVLLII